MQCPRVHRGRGSRLSHTAGTSRAELDPGGRLPLEGMGDEGPRDPAPECIRHQCGQHGEPPSGVFLQSCTGRAHWREKGSPAEGTSGRRQGEGLGGEGPQVQEGESMAGQGREEAVRDGKRRQRRGPLSSPQGSVCFCLFLSGPLQGQTEGRQHCLGGSRQELRRGTEPQVSRHQSFPPSALGPWHPEGDRVRT